MAWLGDLLIRLKAETADFQQDIGKAAYLAEQSGKRIERAFSAAQKALGVLAVTAAAYKYADRTRELIDLGDATLKLSQRTGTATEQLSAYSYAARLANVAQEDLETSLKKLSVNMTNAAGGGEMAKVFSAMGVAVKDANGQLRTNDAVLQDVAGKFSTYAEGPAKAALAVEIFGKSGDKLIPFLNNLREATAEGRRLGVTFGDDFAIAAERYNDNMARIAAQSDAAKIRLAEGVLPRITQIAAEFIEAAARGEKFIGILKALAQLAGFTDPTGVANQRELVGLAEKRLRLQDQLDKLAAGRQGDLGPSPGIQKRIEQIKTEISTLDKRASVLKALNNLDDPSNQDARDRRLKQPATAAAPIVARRDPEREAEAKRYAAALQQLELRLGKLFEMSNTEQTQYQTTAGSLNTLTGAHKRHLVAVAQEIDKREQYLKGLESEEIHRKALADATEQGNAAVRGFNAEQQKALEQQEFEISLIGKTAQEQERLNNARRIELATRQALSGLDPLSPEYAQQSEAIRKRSEDFQRQTAANAEARRNAERSWLTGSKQAFSEYIDSATNAATQAQMLFGNAFRNMEDALVSFVKTGKLDFKSLADSIISDLIRIQVRQGIASAAQGLSGGNIASGLKDLFGFRAAGGPISANKPYIVGEEGPELIVPGSSGTVIPNGQFGSGGGNITLAPVIHIDSRTDAAVVRAEVMRGMAIVQDNLFKDLAMGGSFAKAVGRA